MMERLKHIKETIMNCVEGEVCNLSQADTKELGEAIDMLKDLEEAIYYATITKAMHEKEEKGNKEHETMYYPYPMYYSPNMNENTRYFYDRGESGRYMIYFDPERDMDRDKGKMYYSGNGSSSNSGGGRGGNSNSSGNGGNNGGSRSYYEPHQMYMGGDMMRDYREGRSPMNRRTYMEAKEMHHGKEVQLKELENYMQELTNDITEMIKDSSPEEKQLMQKKIATLAEKVGKVNV